MVYTRVYTEDNTDENEEYRGIVMLNTFLNYTEEDILRDRTF